MKNSLKIIYFVFFIVLLTGCAKEFLDKKPDKALVVPKTLKDLQALLDNGPDLISRTPYLSQIADGDFELENNGITSLKHEVGNAYLWKEDIYEGSPSFDWNKMYEQIFYANVVLEGVRSITRTSVNAVQHDHIKGSALFIRAHALFQLVQQFTEPYSKETAEVTLGVPIRTASDVNIKSKRATLAKTYDHIIEDLYEATGLLVEISEIKSRPNKAAAYGLFARIYLIMGDYEKAYKYSDLTLGIQSSLLDFNEVDTVGKRPFQNGDRNYNDEIIYYTERSASTFYFSSAVTVSKELYDKYSESDLRKVVFYNENGEFKGSYGGHALIIFTGLSTGEMFLIRSECQARLGELSEAMVDLNRLRMKRWKEGESFVSLTASTETEALTLILNERRKELVTRGMRWTDLRRLNKDPRFKVTLKRRYNDEDYQLLPDDKRYVFLIAQDEIERSGIQQNRQ